MDPLAYLQETLPVLKRMQLAFIRDFGDDLKIMKDLNLRSKSLVYAIKVSPEKAVYKAVKLEEYFLSYLTE